MIVNLPTPQSLDEVALRLYFSAWSSLIRIRADFEAVFEPGDDPRPTETDWGRSGRNTSRDTNPNSRRSAPSSSRNELALKAKICAVSPYLLLLRSEPKFSAKVRDIDFSEFRTLDAVDLPPAVNSLCPRPLSDGYIRDYNEVRVLRNKFTHLGHAGQTIQPEELLQASTRSISFKRW
jgi:hypothetical protein